MTAGPLFERLAIVGLGLIGGSLALAARERRLAGRVVGVARRPETRRLAVERGAVDDCFGELESGVAGADLVVFATPVLSIPALVAAAAPALAAGALVTDVGSTKAFLERTIPAILPPGCDYVGGHPMAGSEQAGMEAASATLFAGTCYVVTAPRGASRESLARIAALAVGVGAEVLELDAAQHDAAVARSSHLPHVLAAALASSVSAAPETVAGLVRRLAAGGFRDTTRIAASPPEMWRDVCLTNRDAILAALASAETSLAGFRSALETSDGPRLLAHFEAGRAARESVLGRPGGPGEAA